MKKVFIGIGVILVLVLLGVTAYILRPPAEPSAPIEALPIDTEQAEAMTSEPVDEPRTEEPTQEPVTDEPTEQSVAKELNVEAPTEEPSAEPTAADQSQPTEESGEPSNPEKGTQIFTIEQAESEVRFTLDEELRGNPTTVVGVTDQVAGEIAVDFENPANSQVGTMLINARTLATDNAFRNRAIQNEILDTSDFEFIIFAPTSIMGLPDAVAVGDTFSFQIIGDLTIRDVTQEVTFETTVTVVSEERLEGSASARVSRGDYDLQIPDVPSVANVDEIVLLEIDFVAGIE